MSNYQQSIIYKLCCKDVYITDIYIGSTTNFKQRKRAHKSACNSENHKNYHYNVYKYIRCNGGFDNWDMIQIEQYEATDKRDLESRERYYIETLKSKLNRQIPTRTIKEYREVNKDRKSITDKLYQEKNKEKLRQQSKEYRERNKDEIKDKKKIYYEKNKDEINQQKKQYREKNKDVINRKSKCPLCDKVMLNRSIKCHIKTIHKKNKDEINVKSKCPLCDKIMLNHSIKRHIKTIHK